MTYPDENPGGCRSLLGLAAAPVGRVEFLGWCILAAALVLLQVFAQGGPVMENDSYQYLSVARNFAQGRPGCTSIVHFDTERSHGVVPAPMTTFPSGYPAAVAAVGATGVTTEHAAAAVSAGAILALLLLFRAASQSLDLGGLATRLLFLWTFVNAETLTYGTSIRTEGLFTLLTTAALLLLAEGLARRPEGDRQLPLLLGAHGLIGLAYWVRYAGLFLYVAAGVCLAFLLARRHFRAALNAGLGLLAATAIIALGFLRNLHLVGTWKGGNEKLVHHPLVGVLIDFASSIIRLFSGNGVSARVLILDLIVFPALVLAAVSLFLRRRTLPHRQAVLLGTGLCFLAVYCAALIHLGRTSVITFGVRMFFPLLPISLVLLAMGAASLQRSLGASRQRGFLAAVALVSCAYVALNLLGILRRQPLPQPHEVTWALLRQETEPGVTLETWIKDHVPPGEAIVANQGQATAYCLQRPAVSLVSLSYSRQIWDEQAVRAVMRGYGAHYLILFTGDPPDLFRSSFLASALAGTVPAWLAPVASARGVRVFCAEKP